ncbi:Dolichyl-diphosphooligosaccharide--protein glycosyltransferase subunit [Portunus trituberculatus]|uniref:Dolichyl-diphosphooligosaccharide--protein glycosyltransferase subunit n=1 Tax=Portunus trituberculatus TaxID=210409 RepID=A0A5B7HXU6_PORTR|nr:Dolichyl-diphosphooligosaccharide--protein glycosyltransferase subunit [Portunus trituberculatus]
MLLSIAKKTRKSLTLEVKLDIIYRHERGEKTNSIAHHHGLTPSTVSTIFKLTDSIKKAGETGASYERSGNGRVVEALSRWVFMEEGVLRVVSIDHHLQAQSEPPVAYTIKDDVEYKIKVERLVEGTWKPYVANDMQMEFVRIDPFVRLTMTPSTSGLFSVKFKVMSIKAERS